MESIMKRIMSLRKDNKINGGKEMVLTKNENIKNNTSIKREINQGGGKMDSIRKINSMENKNIEYKKMQELQNKIIGQGNNIALAKGDVPDPRKRQFIKKGILGIIMGIGIAIFSKLSDTNDLVEDEKNTI